MRAMRWWQFGLFGGVVLSLATAVKVVRAIIGGLAGEAGWTDAVGFATAIFAMGFLCGVIVWAGRGLYRWIGIAGDAIVGLAVMVSASRDGALLTAVLECFKVQPVRGSTSRRGRQALLELTTWAERGYDLAITPDGPRGPCYQVQEGIMSLAQVTGLPIIPVSYNLKWKIRSKSWDRFQVPIPFSHCEMVFDTPILVPRDASDEQRKKLRQQLEQQLRSISKD